MNLITVAICTFNRAERLPRLIRALKQQVCAIPFEILVIDNNSTDATQTVLQELTAMPGSHLRFVTEMKQGIVHARNRAIEESANSRFLAFIDDDELPGTTWLKAAADALINEGADCVGGEIRVCFPTPRPVWLVNELLGFLGELKYDCEPFWITDLDTPIWSGNVAYPVGLFETGLRFDKRYNRQGYATGGGEDAVMLRTLLQLGYRIRYRPDMIVEHFIENEKLRRNHFLKLHFIAGRKFGHYETEEYKRTLMGVPPFMLTQVVQQWLKTLKMLARRDIGVLRQAMNGMYALGTICGRIMRWRGA